MLVGNRAACRAPMRCRMSVVSLRCKISPMLALFDRDRSQRCEGSSLNTVISALVQGNASFAVPEPCLMTRSIVPTSNSNSTSDSQLVCFDVVHAQDFTFCHRLRLMTIVRTKQQS